MARFSVESGEINDVQWFNGIVKVFQVKLNVRVFLEDGLLIDSGCASMEKYFLEWIMKRKIDAVFLTHSHEDHVGTCHILQKNYPIYSHPLAVTEVNKRANYPIYRKIFWGIRQSFQSMEAPTTFVLNNSTWETIYTPGHTMDHLSLLNKTSGNLYTGDLFVSPYTKVILKNENIDLIIDSLNKLLQLDFKEMYCQHAGHVPNGKEKLNQKRDYLVRLREDVLALHTKGLSEKEITKKIFPKRYPITFFSSGEWHSKHIITSIIKNVPNL